MKKSKERRNNLFKNPRYMKRLIFYISILALPLLQFAIFYLYVNFDSIILAFQTYDVASQGGYIVSFAGLQNFKNVIEILKNKPQLIENSMILFFFEFFVGIPLALMFSYYIYKHRLFAGWFRVLLFLPQIISGTVFVLIVKILLGEAFTGTPGLPDLIINATVSTRRATLIVFTLFMSFGVNVLLFTGAMTSIPPSLIEASELDGCNPIQEFINVTLPCIFPTIVSFIIMTIGTIFTHQMFLFTFAFGDDKLSTIGFFIYSQAQDRNGGLYPAPNVASYSTLSAFSIMITLILFPLTLGVRKLLMRFGPSTK